MPALTSRQRWLALVMLSAGLLLVMMDMTILIMALPTITADLGSTTTQQLWMVDIYSLVLAGLLIPMSVLADRHGRRLILLIGFAIFGGVSLLVLFANTSEMVIALRAALGIGGAMVMPTTLSMIRTIFTDGAERAKALAIWSVIAGCGTVVGPVVGGALLNYFNWHAAFLVNVPFVAIAIIGGITLLPEAKSTNPPKWDVLATALTISGMVAIVWSIKQLGKHGWGDLTSLAVLLLGAALMGAFVLRCLRHPEPMLDVRLFKKLPFTAGTIAALTGSLTMGGVMLLVAQWLQVILGFSPLQAGLASLPIALGSFLTAPFAPALAQRIGARTVLAGGLAISALGLVAIAMLPLDTYAQIVLPLALVGAGVGSLAIGTAIIMGSTPEHKAGNAAAIEETMYDVGNVLGIAILGSIADMTFRNFLATHHMPAEAQESLVGAHTVAEQAGIPELVILANDAYLSGINSAALLGAGLLAAAAIAGFALVPRGFDITATEK